MGITIFPTGDSKSADLRVLGVRLPLPAPANSFRGTGLLGSKISVMRSEVKPAELAMICGAPILLVGALVLFATAFRPPGRSNESVPQVRYPDPDIGID